VVPPGRTPTGSLVLRRGPAGCSKPAAHVEADDRHPAAGGWRLPQRNSADIKDGWSKTRFERGLRVGTTFRDVRALPPVDKRHTSRRWVHKLARGGNNAGDRSRGRESTKQTSRAAGAGRTATSSCSTNASSGVEDPPRPGPPVGRTPAGRRTAGLLLCVTLVCCGLCPRPRVEPKPQQGSPKRKPGGKPPGWGWPPRQPADPRLGLSPLSSPDAGGRCRREGSSGLGKPGVDASSGRFACARPHFNEVRIRVRAFGETLRTSPEKERNVVELRRRLGARADRRFSCNRARRIADREVALAPLGARWSAKLVPARGRLGGGCPGLKEPRYARVDAGNLQDEKKLGIPQLPCSSARRGRTGGAVRHLKWNPRPPTTTCQRSIPTPQERSRTT